MAAADADDKPTRLSPFMTTIHPHHSSPRAGVVPDLHSAATLLALEASCVRHDVLDLVTVVKRRPGQSNAASRHGGATGGGKNDAAVVQMTSLRAQCLEISTAWSGSSREGASSNDSTRLSAVRRDTDTYMAQLARFLEPPGPAALLPDTSPPEPSSLPIAGPGQLLYYPFGGVDVVTALGLAPSTIRCVVFASAETFAGERGGATLGDFSAGGVEGGQGGGGGGTGGAQGLSRDLALLMDGPSFLRKGGGGTMFDSHDDFAALGDEAGLGGVGALALLRLLGPLARRVEFLSFFDLDDQGSVAFAAPNLLATATCQHAVVGISCTRGNGDDGEIDDSSSSSSSSRRYCSNTATAADRRCDERGESGPQGEGASRNSGTGGGLGEPLADRGGGRCLLFFVRHDTRVPDAAMDRFCARLSPDVLLVKAAPDSLWRPPGKLAGNGGGSKDLSQDSAYSRCLSRALAPAARSGAVVVTDSCQADPDAPPNIFKRDDASSPCSAVKSVAFRDLVSPRGGGGGGGGGVGGKELPAAATQKTHDEGGGAIPPGYDKFGYGNRIFRSTGENLCCRPGGNGSAQHARTQERDKNPHLR